MSVLRTLLASLAIAVAGVAVLAAATDRFQVFTTQAAHRLDVRKRPAAVPDAALETSTGAAVTMADFRGAWLAVDFIYTRCMTYCTVLGGDFAQLQGLLAAPLQQGRLHLLSITFDAEHDDPAALARYKQQFRDRGIGWTAARPVNDAARAALLRAFGVKAASVREDNGGRHLWKALSLRIDEPRYERAYRAADVLLVLQALDTPVLRELLEQARADGAPIQAISVYAPWVTDDNFLLGSKTLLDTLNLSEDKLRLRG